MGYINKKRHELLDLLSDNFIKFNSDNTDSDFKLGVSFGELGASLNLSRDEVELVLAKLYEQKEVQYTNADLVGVHLTAKGASSLTDERYLNLERENNLRDLEAKLAQSNLDTNKISVRNSNTSIFIGVVTGVALIVQILLPFFNSKENEIEKIENKIEVVSKKNTTLEKRFDSLISVHHEVKIDTIRN